MLLDITGVSGGIQSLRIQPKVCRIWNTRLIPSIVAGGCALRIRARLCTASPTHDDREPRLTARLYHAYRRHRCEATCNHRISPALGRSRHAKPQVRPRERWGEREDQGKGKERRKRKWRDQGEGKARARGKNEWERRKDVRKKGDITQQGKEGMGNEKKKR